LKTKERDSASHRHKVEQAVARSNFAIATHSIFAVLYACSPRGDGDFIKYSFDELQAEKS
jgi:small ligand-binding sensory domain FIST